MTKEEIDNLIIANNTPQLWEDETYTIRNTNAWEYILKAIEMVGFDDEKFEIHIPSWYAIKISLHTKKKMEDEIYNVELYTYKDKLKIKKKDPKTYEYENINNVYITSKNSGEEYFFSVKPSI